MINESFTLLNGDCTAKIAEIDRHVDLVFLDPPFNQGKAYENHDDKMLDEHYWEWMTDICRKIIDKSSNGSSIYFMQREKFTDKVIKALNDAGWTYQNLIIWKKKSSAVPSNYRLAKAYQIIVYATKGDKPRVFNKLRIDPPLLVTDKYKREKGAGLTDVWDDIRELTSGYFAGREPFRDDKGERVHLQQSPLALLLRIVMLSSKVGDVVLDPFSGTGTTGIVSLQLNRYPILIEKGEKNIALIQNRLTNIRNEDILTKFRNDYLFTEKLDEIFPTIDTNILIKNSDDLFQFKE